MGEGHSAPASRAARHARIRALIKEGRISSQAELGDILASEGFVASQGTLSRDLVEIGAVRGRDYAGNPCYSIPEGEHPSDVTTGSPAWITLARMTKELCTGVRNNKYLVVLKTPPGAAQYFGAAIDKAGLDIVLGTIAGDDTIALMCATGVDAGELADAFSQMAATGVPAEILSRQLHGESA
ncbi:ArgR family transcriptional regulator [Cutibacterium sp. WCA-380-WT-3A]|uniref:Arginine repressor n=1 Tax=Cutibacterium porci TaxID=2605781 RepID=A0A7K0J8Y6_9ACTN|nr:ArgR family transcriptional regulator [Cutibacterium porci]MSS46405.1 ArgR family transcriptional regulator [Cutibacterium porci]